MPRATLCTEFQQLLVTVRDDKDGGVGGEFLVDDGKDPLDQIAVPGVRPTQVRTPGDAPLFLEPRLVRLEHLAVAAGGDERAE
jgi:hypothetical protein